MASDKVATFTDSNFDADVIKAAQPVLVDFWAEWCGPCRMIGPTIEELAGEYDGKIRVGKLNVDENQQTTVNFGVRGIPAVMLFKGGKMVDQVIGAADKREFKRMIDKHLA
jgi:thioredoxin 1